MLAQVEIKLGSIFSINQIFILFLSFLVSNQLLYNSLMASENIDPNFSYYHEYCRLQLANMRELFNERNELSSKFNKLQKKAVQIEEGERNDDDKKKRFRRTANQIQRHYRCPVQTCQRSYGSEGSLNQHIKIKHNELYHQLNLGGDDSLLQQQRLPEMYESKKEICSKR